MWSFNDISCCPSLRYHTIFSTGSTSGDIFCGDLGEGAQDEINLIQKGRNYGWDIKEGAICNDHPCNMTGYNNIQLDSKAFIHVTHFFFLISENADKQPINIFETFTRV